MTKYVAMDCEMDLLTRENPINPALEPYKEHKVCKISIVNQDGEIILDINIVGISMLLIGCVFQLVFPLLFCSSKKPFKDVFKGSGLFYGLGIF